MRKASPPLHDAHRRFPSTRWLTVKFRDNVLTQNELFVLMRKWGRRICQVECSAAADGITWHLQILYGGQRDLSRVVHALEQLPGVAVAAFGDRIARERAR